MPRSIGFIGYGEVGQLLAAGLRSAGAEVAAYDVALASPERRAHLETRAAEASVALAGSLADLLARSRLVLSAVTSDVATDAARQAAPHLSADHVYIDLNSTRPAVKQATAGIVEATGARFVEAAVMAAVPTLGMKVPMLLCGEAAQEVADELAPYGMNLEVFGGDIGSATAAKMFRSIVVKGMEALLLECALASEPYGITERVLDYVGQGYPGLDWNRLAHFLLGRTAIHGERRAHELVEVSETLRAMGIEPIMSEAGARRLGEAARMNLKARFGDTAPESYHEVIRAIREAKKKKAG